MSLQNTCPRQSSRLQRCVKHILLACVEESEIRVPSKRSQLSDTYESNNALTVSPNTFYSSQVFFIVFLGVLALCRRTTQTNILPIKQLFYEGVRDDAVRGYLAVALKPSNNSPLCHPMTSLPPSRTVRRRISQSVRTPTASNYTQ